MERENVYCINNHHGTSVLNNSKSTVHRGDVLGVPLNETQYEECSLELCDRVALECHTPQHAFHTTPPQLPHCAKSLLEGKKGLIQASGFQLGAVVTPREQLSQLGKRGVATHISQVEVNDVAKHLSMHRAHIYHRPTPLFDAC